ncbi:DUF4268 domain-containing protein [Pedobacter sandarakinus]|uniref:DUF4268 domain-containing protein n=1 Tax=Pedobacter sandarakinus TaxID=353156 RepID=UPI0022458FDF|nr:DUF4268 domain-containing protein [Pedobacter sandarakinus]MCX2573646.1 DUF4268 domain-containing protein [Pedobacter sandarakinus]
MKKIKFSDKGIKERQHLQEWLANQPKVFGGEDLLIIQKEFSGFNDTHERLDLLALDKYGNVVVIENKLDDTGKNVTWQALKYASYCATLKKENIKNIFQDYLDKQGNNEDACKLLAEFYDTEYDDILHLNQGNTQRLIFVANEFRKEVTSTIIWLLNYKLKIQCFKVTPFALDEQMFLTMEQIIPQKDTEDYIIKMADKNHEEISNQEGLQGRHHLRLEFWNKLLPMLKGKTTIFQNISPTKDYWLNSTVAGVKYTTVITKSSCSVLVEFAKPNKDENKKMFDEIYKYKIDIETSFEKELTWERMDAKISSRVGYHLLGVNIFNKKDWDTMSNFLSNNIIRLEQAFRGPISIIKSSE